LSRSYHDLLSAHQDIPLQYIYINDDFWDLFLLHFKRQGLIRLVKHKDGSIFCTTGKRKPYKKFNYTINVLYKSLNMTKMQIYDCMQALHP